MAEITEVQRQTYEDKVHHSYQSGGSNLKSMVRNEHETGTGKHEFRTFGTLEMIDRGQTRSRLEMLDAENGLVECTFKDKVLPVLTDIFDQAKTNAPQLQTENAKAMSLAIKRAEDAILMRAFDLIDFTNCTITGEDGQDISATNVITVSGYSEIVEKLEVGLEAFDKFEMRGAGDMHGDGTLNMLFTEKVHTMMLKRTETQSIFTNEFKSLVDGKVAAFGGYQFTLVGTGRGALGLQKNVQGAGANVRSCYAFVRSSMGIVTSILPRIEGAYLHTYTSNFLNAIMSLGACCIDPRGVVRFDITGG